MLASVRGLVRGMVPVGAYWHLLVRVMVSGLVCGTLAVDGSVCDDFPCGRWSSPEVLGDCGGLQQIGRLAGKVPCLLWEMSANRSLGWPSPVFSREFTADGPFDA